MPKFKRLNQRQEVFAQGIASGLSGVEAFKRVTPGNPKDCDAKANQMRGQPGVEERIRELMAHNAKRAQMSRDEAIEWLTNLIQTPIGSVGPDSPLVQSYETDSAGNVKVRLADKISGMQQLSKMTGWNEPERFALNADDSLTRYILALRREPIGGAGEVLEFENGEDSSEHRPGANE
jgi:hypothetical protein